MYQPHCTPNNTVPVSTFGMHMQQLRHQAAEFVSNGVVPAAVWGVFQSDSMLDNRLSQSVTDALQPLRDIPEADKDWHPGSNDQVSSLRKLSCAPFTAAALCSCHDGHSQGRAERKTPSDTCTCRRMHVFHPVPLAGQNLPQPHHPQSYSCYS